MQQPLARRLHVTWPCLVSVTLTYCAPARLPQEALECCARIGYPVMLKASWGGGGKGIRKVGRCHGATFRLWAGRG